MRYLFACLLSLLLVSPAMAAFDGPGTTQPNSSAPAMQGGFQGPQNGVGSVSTVAAALQAPDDSYVRLEGNILERLANSDDKYVFQDATGKIVVDIDYKLFAGRSVTPQTKVRLHGEVDYKKSGQRQVDVDVLEIL